MPPDAQDSTIAGPALGQQVQQPPSPVPAPGSPSGNDSDARVAGLQRAYDTAIANLGWQGVKNIPTAQDVAELAKQAGRVKDLEGQISTVNQALEQLRTSQQQAAQEAAQAKAQAQKLRVLAEVNPLLVHVADNIPTVDDPAKQREAAEGFLANLAKLGFGPNAAATQPASPPALPIPAGAPPAGTVLSLDQQIAQAQGAMWDAAGKDDSAFDAAKTNYFNLLDMKKKSEGWNDPEWGRPPGLR